MERHGRPSYTLFAGAARKDLEVERQETSEGSLDNFLNRVYRLVERHAGSVSGSPKPGSDGSSGVALKKKLFSRQIAIKTCEE